MLHGNPLEAPPEDSKEALNSAFAEAAKTISVEDCISMIHLEAMAFLGKLGFESFILRTPPGCRAHLADAAVRQNDGSMRTRFFPIKWQNTKGEKREVYPELVTQLQIRADEGLECPQCGYPENVGASPLQLEVIRGFAKTLTDKDLLLKGYNNGLRGDALWLRTFRSDGTKAIRILIREGKFTAKDLVYAELRFWDDLPGAALAKPV